MEKLTQERPEQEVRPPRHHRGEAGRYVGRRPPARRRTDPQRQGAQARDGDGSRRGCRVAGTRGRFPRTGSRLRNDVPRSPRKPGEELPYWRGPAARCSSRRVSFNAGRRFPPHDLHRVAGSVQRKKTPVTTPNATGGVEQRRRKCSHGPPRGRAVAGRAGGRFPPGAGGSMRTSRTEGSSRRANGQPPEAARARTRRSPARGDDGELSRGCAAPPGNLPPFSPARSRAARIPSAGDRAFDAARVGASGGALPAWKAWK